MAIQKSTALTAVLLFIDHTTALVSNAHKYFNKKNSEAVDRANAYSPEAMPYPAKYPTINIYPWLDPFSSSEEERQDVVLQVLEQAMGAGSFNIVGHNVTIDFLDYLETSVAEFFAQSLDFKRQFSSDIEMAGYTGNMEERYGATVYNTTNPREQEGDMREIFNVIYKSPSNVQGPEYFQRAVDNYIEQLQPVKLALTMIFSAALGLAKGVDLPLTYLYDADIECTGLLRAFRYPAMPANEYGNATKLLPHSDFGTLTIIQSSKTGLEEVRDGRWIEVPINKGELHVTVGDIYSMWSNELFTNNVHRVSSRAVNDRISFAYFLAAAHSQAKKGAGIEPVCAQDETPKFSRVSSISHLDQYILTMLEGESVLA